MYVRHVGMVLGAERASGNSLPGADLPVQRDAAAGAWWVAPARSCAPRCDKSTFEKRCPTSIAYSLGYLGSSLG